MTNKIISTDIRGLTEELYIITGISSGGANDSVSSKTYKVWLEK